MTGLRIRLVGLSGLQGPNYSLAQMAQDSQFCPDNIFITNAAHVSRNSMRPQIKQHVIIVGAGPVGLVTANLLADEGIPVTLVEMCVDLPRDLRASTFHPPTLDMLERFGVVGSNDRAGVDLSDLAIPRSERRGDRNLRVGPIVAGHANIPTASNASSGVLASCSTRVCRQSACDGSARHQGCRRAAERRWRGA